MKKVLLSKIMRLQFSLVLMPVLIALNTFINVRILWNDNPRQKVHSAFFYKFEIKIIFLQKIYRNDG
jgi:hypothetical protein